MGESQDGGSKQINFYAHVGVGITGYEIFVFRKI